MAGFFAADELGGRALAETTEDEALEAPGAAPKALGGATPPDGTGTTEASAIDALPPDRAGTAGASEDGRALPTFWLFLAKPVAKARDIESSAGNM